MDIDLIQTLSPNLTPKEEEVIKLHNEIKERLHTYEKVNRKFGWQVEEINELVDEQVDKRDHIVSKYTNIFSNMEKKLSDMELKKKQTTKMKEDIIKKKKEEMKDKLWDYSEKGIDYMKSQCNILNELAVSNADTIEEMRQKYFQKERQSKVIEDEYSNKHFREEYYHKKNMKNIQEEKEKMVEKYWEQPYP